MMSNQKIYEMVTNIICERLEQGIIPWHRPWKGGVPEQNYATGYVYKGINPIICSSRGFSSPYWLTMNQANKLGGNVRGSYTPIVFNKVIKVKDAEEEDGERDLFLMRFYKVWNIEQCEGIDFENVDLKEIDFEPLERCEEVVENYGTCPKIRFKEQRAYYNPTKDFVNMPQKNSFTSAETYYSTLFHELVHSTAHPGRLDRNILNKFGDEAYSKEELCAELGAAMLCTICGIAPPVIENSAAYIQSWLKKLNEDKGMIWHCGRWAQKAVDYMLNVAEEKAEEEVAS